MGHSQALSAQLLVDAAAAYNAAAEVAELLPDADPSKAVYHRLRDQPQLLKCSWREGQARVESVPWSTAAAAALPIDPLPAEKLGLRVIGAGAASDLDTGPHPTAAPALAVVEDRGVAVSREQLRTELRQATAGMAGTGPSAPVLAEHVPADVRGAAGLGAAPADPGTTTTTSGPLGKKKRGRGRVVTIVAVDDMDMPDAAAVAVAVTADAAPPTRPVAPLPAPNPQLAALPQRSTAFISVDSLAPLALAGRGKVKKEKSGGAPKSDDPGPSAPAKSWEDWLNPAGDAAVAAQPGQAGGGSKKKRRR